MRSIRFLLLSACSGLLFAATSCQTAGPEATVTTLKAMQSGAPEWTDAGPGDVMRPLGPRRQVEEEAPVVSDDDYERNWQTFGVRIGGALLDNFNTKIRYDGRVIGDEIDFEDDLGFQGDTQVFRFDAFYRFNRRHRLDFSLYDIQRSSGKEVDREFIWNGEPIPINARTAAFIDTRIIKFTYRYSFLTSEDWELGASFGMYGMGLETGLAAELNGIEIIPPGTSEFSVELPLPVVGFHAQWQFARNFWLRGSTELFWVQLQGVADLERLEGFLSDTVIAIEWDVFKHAGLGLGYNLFAMDVEVENSPRTLSLRYGYQGVLLFGKFGF